jgi:hypothetical protein
MRLPKARTHKLTIRELPDETLAYDHLAAKAHCLNRTAALVWKHCDGKTTVRELAAMLQRELGIRSAEPLVHLTLEKLSRRGLLETASELPAIRQDRRKLLRKLALAALPVILTMTAPRAAQAASQAGPPTPPFCQGKPNGTACGGGSICCSGTCTSGQSVCAVTGQCCPTGKNCGGGCVTSNDCCPGLACLGGECS